MAGPWDWHDRYLAADVPRWCATLVTRDKELRHHQVTDYNSEVGRRRLRDFCARPIALTLYLRAGVFYLGYNADFVVPGTGDAEFDITKTPTPVQLRQETGNLRGFQFFSMARRPGCLVVIDDLAVGPVPRTGGTGPPAR